MRLIVLYVIICIWLLLTIGTRGSIIPKDDWELKSYYNISNVMGANGTHINFSRWSDWAGGYYYNLSGLWSKILSKPGWITGNYTGWTNIGQIPDWIEDNYTAWTNIGQVPLHIVGNYTNDTFYWHTCSRGTNCLVSADILDIDDVDVEADANTYVDIAGDVMTGDLNMSYNNISFGWSELSTPWAKLKDVPAWVSGNYTAWSNIGQIPAHIGGNYTNDTFYFGKHLPAHYLDWDNLADVPGWVSGNYTGWTNIGQIPAHIGGNYTAKAFDLSCVNCLNEGEIEDIYVLTAGDVVSGVLNFTAITGIAFNSEIDHRICYYDGGTECGEYFEWDQTLDEFVLTDDLDVGATCECTGIYSTNTLYAASDIYTTGTGDDLWLGNTDQATSYWRGYADGSLNISDDAFAINASGDVVETGYIYLDDNEKVYFGDGRDVKLYFDGTYFIIEKV